MTSLMDKEGLSLHPVTEVHLNSKEIAIFYLNRRLIHQIYTYVCSEIKVQE